jgi:hypothetical protein
MRITAPTLSLFLWHTVVSCQIGNAFHSCLRSGAFAITQGSLSPGSFLDPSHEDLLQKVRIHDDAM